MNRYLTISAFIGMLSALLIGIPKNFNPAVAQTATQGFGASSVFTQGEQSRPSTSLQPAMENNVQSYTITDLGPLIYPTAINNRRQIVGVGTCNYLWENGIHTCLNDPDGQVLSVREINEQEQVLFQASNLESQILWTDANHNKLIESNEKQALPVLPGYERVMVHALNDLGTAVGNSLTQYEDGSYIISAVSWTNGNPTSLGGMQAHDINNVGIIVGLDVGGVGVRWVNDVMEPLPAGFSPTAINDRGEIVGAAYVESQFTHHQHLWLPAPAYGLPAGLNDLGFVWNGSGLADINENGLIIMGNNTRYVWQAGVLTDVNTLLPPNSGWTNLSVEAINDHGDIVGRGTFNGQQLGFLLSPPQPAWTLLFYLDADNNLAHSYPAIFQHLESMAHLPGVRILVLWDHSGLGDSAYYEVQSDADPANYALYEEGVNLWSQGELNMGAPFTLSDFITWGVSRSPSDHYALILDDHGSGLGGLAWDDTDNGDFITLPELKLALSTAQGATGEKMDVLYMAMCLMGMLEDAYQVRGLADFYVASEEIQTTYTNYLAGFDPSMSPSQVALSLAVAYANEIAARPPADARAYTISVADLSQLNPLATAANELGEALAERMNVVNGTLTTISSLVQRFDNESPNGITTADTYIDLYDFADLVAQNMGSEANIVAKAQAVKQAVDNYILFEAHASIPAKNVDNSHGVSIFFPAISSSFYSADNYDFAVGATWQPAGMTPTTTEQATTWGGFLVDYFQSTQPGGPDDPTPPLPLSKDFDTIRLYLPMVAR